MEKRKPPRRVVDLSGKPLEDRITQEQYRLIQKQQALIHEQYIELAIELVTMHQRLIAGATEESGEFFFDRETKLVRSRKKAAQRQASNRQQQAVSE